MDTCLIMSIAALFIIARNLKQCRCSLTEERIKKMWYTYTMEYYLAVKNDIFSVAQFLRKLGSNLLQDLVIPLLGIYPKDAQACHKDLCSTMFIAALFVIFRI